MKKQIILPAVAALVLGGSVAFSDNAAVASATPASAPAVERSPEDQAHYDRMKERRSLRDLEEKALIEVDKKLAARREQICTANKDAAALNATAKVATAEIEAAKKKLAEAEEALGKILAADEEYAKLSAERNSATIRVNTAQQRLNQEVADGMRRRMMAASKDGAQGRPAKPFDPALFTNRPDRAKQPAVFEGARIRPGAPALKPLKMPVPAAKPAE